MTRPWSPSPPQLAGTARGNNVGFAVSKVEGPGIAVEILLLWKTVGTMPGVGVESDKNGVVVLFTIAGADVVKLIVLFGSSVGAPADGVVTVVRLANGGVTTVVFLRTIEDGAVPEARPVPVGNPVGTKGLTVVALALGVVWTTVEFSRGRLVGGSGVDRVVKGIDVNKVELGAKLGRGNTATLDVGITWGVATLVASTAVEESMGGDGRLVVELDDVTSGRVHEELSVPEVMVVVIVSVRTTGAAVPVPLWLALEDVGTVDDALCSVLDGAT